MSLRFFVALLLFSLTAGACRNSAPASIDAAGTEILWDRWGVPHIFSETWEGLFYGFGWAQAHSHGDLILRLYGEARGRSAEYWGEENLESDRYVRRMGVPRRAAEWLEVQSPAIRAYLEAFASGINGYVQANPEAVDDAVEVVLLVTASDVLAHVQRVIHLEFVGQSLRPTIERVGGRGSNGWAIGPSRSASGNAMLLANPHLPWSGLFIWYEAQLVAPDLDAYGATLVGFPILGVAFNDYLGWTHTVNPMDGADLYEVFLRGDGYNWPQVGEGPDIVREFETETETLRVRQPDGTYREETLLIRRTDHGPVIAEGDASVLVARIAGLDEPHLVEQYWNMMRAKNLESFESALRRLQSPFFNVIYADREGHILYLFGGLNPVRGEGTWDFWQGVIPGNHPATLWTRTHDYEDLPRLLDPESGWLQNANEPPWTSTFPQALSPLDYPSYLAPPGGMDFRSQRSVRMLAEDPSITFEELIEYKHSTRMELADRILDDLIPAARRRGGLAAEAAAVLSAWDREANASSRGAVLFQAWYQRMGPNLFRTPWDEGNPRTTPDGLADPDAAARELETAAREVRAAHGAIDVPWGDVYRLRFSGRDLPADGGPGSLGIFRVVEFAPGGDGFRPVHGDSYVAAVEFSDPVRARVLVSYGNASQPRSPHRGDQLELFAAKQLRTAWRSRDEIEANLERREVLR